MQGITHTHTARCFPPATPAAQLPAFSKPGGPPFLQGPTSTTTEAPTSTDGFNSTEAVYVSSGRYDSGKSIAVYPDPEGTGFVIETGGWQRRQGQPAQAVGEGAGGTCRHAEAQRQQGSLAFACGGSAGGCPAGGDDRCRCQHTTMRTLPTVRGCLLGLCACRAAEYTSWECDPSSNGSYFAVVKVTTTSPGAAGGSPIPCFLALTCGGFTHVVCSLSPAISATANLPHPPHSFVWPALPACLQPLPRSTASMVPPTWSSTRQSTGEPA